MFAEASRGDIEVGIRAWARHSDDAKRRLQRVDERRLNYVAELLRAAGVAAPEAKRRSALMYRRLVGEMVMRTTGASVLSKQSLESLTRWMLDERFSPL